MAKQQRPAGNIRRKPFNVIFQERLKSLFSPKDELPASISIHQAEEMAARIKELEERLAEQPASFAFSGGFSAATSSTLRPSSIPAESTQGDLEGGDKVMDQNRQKRIGLWTAATFAAISLVFLVFSVYVRYVVQQGYADISDMTLQPVTVVMIVASLISYRLIQRDRHEPGTWILLSLVLIPPVLAVLVINNAIIVALLYVAILASILITRVLPRVSRRRAWLATGISILAILGIQAWDPAFRVGSSNLPDFSVYVTGAAALVILGFFFAHQLRSPRVQTRLTAQLLLATIPVVAILVLVVSSTARTRTEAGANTELQGTNQGTALSISSWLDLNVNALEQLTLLPGIVSMDPAQQKPILEAMAQAYPYMYLVSTTDLNGMNVARNDAEAPKDYSDRDWFQQARAGAPLTYQSLIGRTSGVPALVMSMPIRSPAGRIVGVAMFAAELTDLATQTQVTAIGERGYTYIIDANNQVLAHPDPTYTAELRDLSEYPPVAALRQGQTGLVAFTDENGGRWRAFGITLDNGWVIIAQRPESEILAPARQFQTVLIILMAAAGVILLSLVSFAIRRTLQPISTLTNAASAIASGNLSQVVEVKSRDEIGTLAATFNNMTGQLRDLIGSLERRVAERTHDLELASEVGRAVSEKTADLSSLLTEAVDLIHERFELYHTQLYLTDPAGRTLILRAGTGEVGTQLIQRGHQLPIGPGSLNGRAAAEKQAMIVADTVQSPDFLANPLLPDTRSEMAVPLLVGDQVVGVLDMQSDQPGALNETNLPAFEALAAQLAIAIQNAALFSETRQARAEVEEQVRRLTEEGWQDFLDAVQHQERIGFAFEQNQAVRLGKEKLSAAPTKGSLNVPIRVSNAEIGTVQIAGEEGQRWNSDDTELVQAVATQLAQHIENLRLLAQAEQYRSEAEQAIRRLTREGWETFARTRQDSAIGYAYDLHEVQPLTVKAADAGSQNETVKRPLVVNREIIGELAVGADPGRRETDVLVAAVAEQLSSHLENLRLSEQNEKRAREMETVAEVGATTATLLDPDRLLQTVVDMTRTRFGVYHVHIYLADQSWQTLLLAAGAGEVGRGMVASGHTIPMDAEQSLVARAARERQAVIVDDVRAEPDFLPNPALPETRSEMAVPMIVGDQVLGVFDVQSDNVSGFTKEDAAIYTTLSSQVAVALQNARLYVEQAATVTQLRELDRLKTSFLANMSHELRTPLNSILGFADVILNELDGPLTENMTNDLQLIHKNGQHLLSLINNVLDMAKIEAGKMSLTLDKFRLYDTVKEVVSITTPMVNEAAVSLYIEEDSDTETEVEADRIRIRQVMLNLVGNAIKFTEKGEISVRTERQGGKMLIRVRDTGMGIPAEQQELVFQEFTQVDASATRKVGGTGLGLPISRRLIEMHGGRIWVESTGIPGEGSAFFLELPIEAAVTELVEQKEKL